MSLAVGSVLWAVGGGLVDPSDVEAIRIGPEPPATWAGFRKPAGPAFDLQGKQPTADVLAIHHLDVSVDAEVLGRWLTKQLVLVLNGHWV